MSNVSDVANELGERLTKMEKLTFEFSLELGKMRELYAKLSESSKTVAEEQKPEITVITPATSTGEPSVSEKTEGGAKKRRLEKEIPEDPIQNIKKHASLTEAIDTFKALMERVEEFSINVEKAVEIEDLRLALRDLICSVFFSATAVSKSITLTSQKQFDEYTLISFTNSFRTYLNKKLGGDVWQNKIRKNNTLSKYMNDTLESISSGVREFVIGTMGDFELDFLVPEAGNRAEKTTGESPKDTVAFETKTGNATIPPEHIKNSLPPKGMRWFVKSAGLVKRNGKIGGVSEVYVPSRVVILSPQEAKSLHMPYSSSQEHLQNVLGLEVPMKVHLGTISTKFKYITNPNNVSSIAVRCYELRFKKTYNSADLESQKFVAETMSKLWGFVYPQKVVIKMNAYFSATYPTATNNEDMRKNIVEFSKSNRAVQARSEAMYEEFKSDVGLAKLPDNMLNSKLSELFNSAVSFACMTIVLSQFVTVEFVEPKEGEAFVHEKMTPKNVALETKEDSTTPGAQKKYKPSYLEKHAKVKKIVSPGLYIKNFAIAAPKAVVEVEEKGLDDAMVLGSLMKTLRLGTQEK